MASKIKLMVILAALVVFGATFAVPGASASNPFMKGWLHQPGAKGGVSESSSSSEVIVLQDEKIGGAEVNSPKCFWGNGENSGETVTGEKFWFYDTHMRMCPDKNSETGWVKVAGGMTGRDCENEVKPNTPPKPRPKIILVRSFGKFKAVANAHAREKVTGSCGVAEASANAHGMAYGMTRVQAKNNAKFVANAKAKATASAKARVALVCSPPAATPEVPKPPAEIACGNGEIKEVKNGQIFCVKQTNEAEQHCQAVGGTWNGSQQLCTIIQINANCSNVTVVNGSGNVVETKQEGNCNQEIKEEKEEEKPCGCTPPPKEEVEPPVVHLETIQELETEEVRVICAHVESPNNDPVTVHFEAEYGEFANSGTGSAVSGGRSCATYTAPPEVPENASHCDTIEVLVRDTTTGKSATDSKSVKILEQTEF